MAPRKAAAAAGRGRGASPPPPPRARKAAAAAGDDAPADGGVHEVAALSSSAERWNTHLSTGVALELFGARLALRQDPGSHNLGTTVWDASIVLAKYMERCASKGGGDRGGGGGELSRRRLAAARVLELGAGAAGLGGLAAAHAGCARVTLTDADDAAVLALLRRNVEANAPRPAGGGGGAAAAAAAPRVAPLDWRSRGAGFLAPGEPGFDLVLAADCVYSEAACGDLLATAAALLARRGTLLVANEFRSASVHAAFAAEAERRFRVRRVPAARLHPRFQHPAIQVYALKHRRDGDGGGGSGGEGGGDSGGEGGGGDVAEPGGQAPLLGAEGPPPG